jgi:hypothetical protein
MLRYRQRGVVVLTKIHVGDAIRQGEGGVCVAHRA